MNKFLIFVLLVTIAMSACQNYDSEVKKSREEEFIPAAFEKSSAKELSQEQKSMMDIQAQFNCDFFKAVVKTASEANLVVSPLSMSMNLAMLSNGASGETLSEILGTLGFETTSLDELNDLNNRLYSILPSIDPKAKLCLANAIWVNDNFELKNAFINICSRHYDARVKALDLYSDEARNVINQWAESKTNGLIKEFYSEAPTAEVILMNALYFKAPWLSEFDEKLTSKDNFYGEEYTSKVDFMENEEMNCFIFGSSIGNVMSFPFGSGAYKLTFITPYEDMTKAINSLTPETIREILSNTNSGMMKEWVKIPKFKLDYRNDEIANALNAMGMTKAFSPTADFSAISNHHICLDRIIQKVAFEIDEKGGEGAAVSGEDMSGATGSDYPRQPVTLNCPFMFLLSESNTGAILFMGKVSQL